METGGGVSIGTQTSGLISSATKKESWKFVIFCSLILIDCWFTRIACVCVCVCVCVSAMVCVRVLLHGRLCLGRLLKAVRILEVTMAT